MEFKTKFEHTVVDFITNELTELNPVLCIGELGCGKTTALVFAALDVEGSVVVLCPGKRLSDHFLSVVRDILNKRGHRYCYVDDDSIKINENKTIYAYPVGQETWDVHIDDDVKYLFFDDANHLHPMVVRRLVSKMDNKKIALTSRQIISELQGVVKVKITNTLDV